MMGKVNEEEAMQGPAGREEEPIQGPRACEDRILVSVRLRPLNEKEIERNDVSDWECINDYTIIYRNHLSVSERSMYPTAYTFDRVFSPDCVTRKVYEEGAKEVALSVVSGINSSIFAYGQTSSGKTYTMSGITEYAMSDIYDYIERHKDREFILKFSALEIYNESVRDLLSADSSTLRLLDDPERGTIVEKLTEETLRDWSHFKELLSICETQRQIGETSLNETSSRSHQILRLTVESSACEFLSNDKASSLTASVNFVDLAGSERASQALSAGTRLKEGCHINRSLLTLGTVVRKLSKGRNGHIPYRDSKLTRILQSSLGGNARTAIICTLSPAQSHVEQSRNTLLFASCAKEVTTNAQVNIVMSDKTLVKQLQKELARLENELRSAGPTSSISDSAVVLREKDMEIEKLKKEVSELTLQRDLARSQVEYLLRQTVNDRPSMADLDPQYPKLRVRDSSENLISKSETPDSQHPHCLDISVRSSNTSRYSDRHSSSSDENFFQILDFEEKSSHANTPQHNKDSVSNCVTDRSLRDSVSNCVTDRSLREIETRNDENGEDLCRDVRCIEMEGSTNRYAHSTMSESYGDSNSAEVNPGSTELTDAENENEQNQEVSFTTSNGRKEWKTIDPDVVTPSPAKPSPQSLEKDTCSPESLRLTRSSSCKASLMNSRLSSRRFENDEKGDSVLSLSLEKDQIGRHEGVKRKFTALKLAVEIEKLTRNGSQSSGRNEKQPAEDTETQSKPVTRAKSVRDIGLDPIQFDLGSPLNWPFEFKRLQREIIQLWHACNVSLVHRTYFFLLFKGDPKDSIYMEVEHRRLTLLKDAFSRDNPTAEDSPTMTPDSSLKTLREERQMLSSQMKKKFSEEQRENLFLKWGIGLQTKQRRLQLAHLLWSNTEDTDHITESASIVAKLVGLVKPEQAIKEMFGVKFTPKRGSRIANLWKKSLVSFKN